MRKPSFDSVVLIPGLGNTRLLWRSHLDTVAEFGRPIIPDYRGSLSIREMADRVLEQATEKSLAVVGFSLGGYVALDLLDRYPERVERLALISSSPYADNSAAKEQRKQLIDKSANDYLDLLGDMGRFVVSGKSPAAASARQALVEMGLDLGTEEFCRQQIAAMNRPDCRDQLERIDVPTRVLCGENDFITPLEGNRYLAENITGASLEVVSDAGHLLPLEHPDAVRQFLRSWLSAESGT